MQPIVVAYQAVQFDAKIGIEIEKFNGKIINRVCVCHHRLTNPARNAISSESENVGFLVVNSGKLANKSLMFDGKLVVVVGRWVVVVVVVVFVVVGFRVVSEGFKSNR